jgi:hypothetical protein
MSNLNYVALAQVCYDEIIKWLNGQDLFFENNTMKYYAGYLNASTTLTSCTLMHDCDGYMDLVFHDFNIT